MAERRAHILPFPVFLACAAVSVGVIGWAETPRAAAAGMLALAAVMAALTVDAWRLRRGGFALFFAAVAGLNVGGALGILWRFA